MKPKVLVTSAAGHTGLPATLQSLERGFPVRAFVCTDDVRAKRLTRAGTEVFVGDIRSFRDVRSAACTRPTTRPGCPAR